MAKIISRKIALFAVVLLIGGGILGISMLNPSQNRVTANAAPKTEADFLNYDMVIGDENAPVEIIEYAAISCPHCAYFHVEVYPELKKKYLDTGKAKLIYRNFIFDNPFDVFATSLLRCVPEEKFMSTLETYFSYQKVWNNIPELQRLFKAEGRDAALKYAQAEVAKIGTLAGIDGEAAGKCFANEAVINYLLKVRQDAVVKYNVQSTPTIIVGGKRLAQNDMASLVKAIEDATK